MNIACYVFAALSVVGGLVTAILYTLNKPKAAYIAKMSASTLFVMTGIMALSISQEDKVISVLMMMGLVGSMWGDFFLARRESSRLNAVNNFAYGVHAFGIAQILFFVAILMRANMSFHGHWSWLILLTVVPMLLGVAFKRLTFRGTEIYYSLAYAVLVAMTMAVAISTYRIYPTTANLVTMLASIFFTMSDMTLCLYLFSEARWKKSFHFPIMILYFAAEAMYAISIML